MLSEDFYEFLTFEYFSNALGFYLNNFMTKEINANKLFSGGKNHV